MAREPLLDQIANKPPATKVAILLAILAAAGLVYYQLLYSPLSDELGAAESKNQKLERKNERLVERERRYGQLLERKSELEGELQKSLVSLPASSELPSFFVHLQKQAAAAGVSVTSWSRVKERPAGEYVKVPVKMELTGTFHEIIHYFKLLHETERIISVEDFQLSGARMKSDELVLTAKFNASTFRQKEGSALFPPVSEEGGGGNDFKSKVERARNKRDDKVEGRVEDAEGQKP